MRRDVAPPYAVYAGHGSSGDTPRSHRAKNDRISTSPGGSSDHSPDVSCPELLITGSELERKNVVLQPLVKKGKRFDSPWRNYLVGIYAHVLFFFENRDALPHGVVPLMGCNVKPVDRILKLTASADNGEPSEEDCGPCWKITSSAGRIFLFRSPSESSRASWMERVQHASLESLPPPPPYPAVSPVEKTPRRRRVSSTSRLSLGEPQHRSQNDMSPEVSSMLRDAMLLLKKQKEEITELKKQLQEQKEALALKEAVPPETETETIPTEVESTTRDSIASSSPSEPPAKSEPEPAPVSSSSSVSAASPKKPAPEKRMSMDSNEHDIIQQQAMEIAEIARNLQSTFRTPAPARPASPTSPSSDAYFEAIDSFWSADGNDSIATITSGNSGIVELDDEDDDDMERLSEFQESEEHFLEANGLIDSVHTVVNVVATQSDERISIHEESITTVTNETPRSSVDEAPSMRTLERQSSSLSSTSSRPDGSNRSLLPGDSVQDFFDFALDPLPRSLPPPPKSIGAMLVEENNVVLASLLQTATREEKMSLLFPLLRVFASHKRLGRLIMWAIEVEVSAVMSVATLFRSDDYASRILSTYSKAIGSEFIRKVLKKPIRQIFSLKIADLELNPDKSDAPRTSVTTSTNADNLMKACQQILDAIVANVHLIPASYYHICSYLNEKMIIRFDGSTENLPAEDPLSVTRSVIGGFLFLRFICPAITTPHLYDLTDKEPQPETRRVLVLVTKLLFKTATSVMFGEREPQFRVLNPFIERNADNVLRLFTTLSVAPIRPVDDCFTADSRSVFSDVALRELDSDYKLIRSVVEKNLETIESKISSEYCSPDITESLKAALAAPEARESLLAQKMARSKRMNIRFLSFGKRYHKPQTES